MALCRKSGRLPSALGKLTTEFAAESPVAIVVSLVTFGLVALAGPGIFEDEPSRASLPGLWCSLARARKGAGAGLGPTAACRQVAAKIPSQVLDGVKPTTSEVSPP